MRRLALGLTLAAAAALAAAPAAPATQSLTCTIHGLFVADPGVSPFLATGEGDYSYGSAPECSYTDTATGVSVPAARGSLASDGRLTYAACGLGGMNLFGDGATGGTRITFFDPRVPDIDQLDYLIELEGWSGTLRGGNLIQDGQRTTGSLNSDTAWSVTGAVEVQPSKHDHVQAAIACATSLVPRWNVRGAMTAVKP